jgi:hypothetical protein
MLNNSNQMRFRMKAFAAAVGCHSDLIELIDKS